MYVHKYICLCAYIWTASTLSSYFSPCIHLEETLWNTALSFPFKRNHKFKPALPAAGCSRVLRIAALPFKMVLSKRSHMTNVFSCSMWHMRTVHGLGVSKRGQNKETLSLLFYCTVRLTERFKEVSMPLWIGPHLAEFSDTVPLWDMLKSMYTEHICIPLKHVRGLSQSLVWNYHS